MEKSMKKRPVIGITEMKTLPGWSDANMSYAATGFVERVQKAGGFLDLANWRCSLGQDYISMIDSSSLPVDKCLAQILRRKEITIDSDDNLLTDLFELALIEEAR